MNNPDWNTDEHILALNLYFELKGKGFNSKSPEIIKLSKILNNLPYHKQREETFRNPKGVAMKLHNFKRVDPEYKGKGLQKGNKLEKVLWEKYADNKDELRERTLNIIKFIENPEIEITAETPEFNDEEIEVFEGELFYYIHTKRERAIKITTTKKLNTLKQKGKLECEVCEFDFFLKYGILGKGFIECHHIKPISKIIPGEPTRLKDLALVCSNCHRMLHRGKGISIESLKKNFKK